VSRPLTRSSRGLYVLLLLAVAGLTLVSSSGRSAIAPAGQVITSRSTARYELFGQFFNAFSNEISVSVMPLAGPFVTPDGTTAAPGRIARAFPAQRVTFSYLLRNAGNVPDIFDLGLAYPAPSDFIPSAAAVYLDVDRDSIVDMGEAAVTSVGPLGPGDDVSLVVEAALPSGLPAGALAHLDLIAHSRADTSAWDRNNVVRIVARAEAQVTLSLEADKAAVLPGDSIGFTLHFAGGGERAATAVALSALIDAGGMCDGADYVPGSIASTVPGRFEFYDSAVPGWVAAAPPVDRVKGVRLLLDSLSAGAGGDLSFSVRVRDARPAGDLCETGASNFTGGDGLAYSLASNDVTVRVGRVSSIAIGPRGNPTAATGSPEDRVVVTLDRVRDAYTIWQEILNGGNFADSVRVAIADSATVPDGWQVDFVDSTGAPLPGDGAYGATVGTIPRGRSAVVGLRLQSTPEGFRRFAGRELTLSVEAASLFFQESSDRVDDILVKANIPIISIEQSIREPVALVGDVLSFIATVSNVTTETTLDSVTVVENLSPGLGYAGGNLAPRTSDNVITWSVGALAPGERREIIFRARVKAGQETGRLVSSALASGVAETGESVSDGPAQAAVLIVEGIFTRRGIVSGAVFEDADSNGVWNGEERGVRGVSVFIEDGTYAVTDSFGLYSIPGVVEGRHVVRIDPATWPDSLEAGSKVYFGFGETGEILIDLAPSGHRRVDFALVRRSGSRGAAPDTSTAPGASPADTSAAGAPAGHESASSAPSFLAITIPGTHFNAGLAEIEGVFLSRIAALSLWIKDHPGWRLFIVGHTDSIPVASAAFPSNLELSIARARSVFQILRMNGIPEERMDYSGVGSRSPVAPNATEEGRLLNRRVEIQAVPPAGYSGGDPDLPGILGESEKKEYALADSTGICADIVKPDEGTIFFSRGEIDVEITSPLGSETELYVNGVPIGKDRIGLKKIDVANNTFGSIFYGVKIEEGKNDVLVVCREYGGKRSTCVRHIYLAGQPKTIVPERMIVNVPADGRTAGELVFLVSDTHGLPVRDGVFVTVSGPRELVEKLDANPQQPGVQVATAGGRVALKLPPMRDSRQDLIRVTLNNAGAAARVVYESPLRKWFLFGYGEGVAGYSNLSGAGSTHRLLEKQRDGAFAEGKLSFYGQGEIAPGHVLTCAVDTRPQRDDMLFRRIEPEKYYPVYGDASELRFNTASRSGTFLRLDHRRYGAMLGDFRTDLGTTEFTMYNRSFNGLAGEARYARGAVKAFVTRTDQVTYQEEMRAEGTSGFYFLKHYPLVENSEKIRIEVRDRYRSERIVRVDYQQINRDYDINYLDGSILFKESVPAFDESLNPVTIVASYECRGSGERNFIYGVRSATTVTDSLTFGATAVLEEEGVENYSLLGFDLTGQIREGVRIASEFAHSEKFLLGGADAFRILLTGEQARAVRWNAYYRAVDENFFNSSFSGGKTELGGRKFGGDVAWKLNQAFGVSAKGYRYSFRERDETKDYVDLVGHYTTGLLEGKLGFAAAGHGDTRTGDQASVLMLTGLALKKPNTAGEIQWDQILTGEDVDEYPNRLSAKLSRRLWRAVSATLKHEYRTGSRSGTRHLTQLGLESNITESMQLYSRYQLEGAVSGERGQATMGAKKRIALAEDLTANVTVEKLATVSGTRAEDYFSLATGALYLPLKDDYRVKGNYEIRLEPDRNKHLAELAAVRRLSERWSVLVKGDLWFSDEKREDNHVKQSSTLGFALRPRAARNLTVLSLLQSRYERNSPAHPNAIDKEILSSVEANYTIGTAWELEGKLAGRRVSNSFRDYSASASAFMFQAQVIRIIAEKWDVSLKARVVRQRETATTSYGGGLELGRLVSGKLWIGAGYDFGGHDDPDAPVNGFTRSGFHFGMRLKFNEKIMNYFYGGRDEGRGAQEDAE
jgi:outer membrane protein OmpA-like peptidoglycan-associated protein